MFTYSFYILFAVLMVMAVLMVAVPMPRDDARLHGYRLSRWMISLSYVALAVYCLVKGRLTLELMHPVFLFMANVQACLLALSHINLINPRRVTNRYVMLHFTPLIVCLCLYGIIRLFFPHIPLTTHDAPFRFIREPEVWIRILWMTQYVALCLYFAWRFVCESKRWQTLAADFFAEDKMINVHMIRVSFFFVICIGLVTLGITSSLNPTLSAILNITIMVLYIVVGILFMLYPSLFIQMKPVLYDYHADAGIPGKSSNRSERWEKMRETILNQQLYLRRSITLEQMAHELCVSRTVLSNAINQEEGMNFNSFINRLRILESQRIMKSEPSLSFQELAERVGFSEQSNFTNAFKHWTGRTPREYKEYLATL